MNKRIITMFASLLFVFSGILARLYRLTDGELGQAATAQSKITVTLAQVRGTIYDQHLTPLTNQNKKYKASVVSTPNTLAALSDTLPTAEWEQLRERLKSGKPVVINLDSAPVAADGISIALVPERYATEQLAAHVIGYVGDGGIHGVCGIEKACDELLIDCGGEVKVTYETDGRGQVLPGGTVTIENTVNQAEAGVVLTLDARIQNAVEKRCRRVLTKGAVVVMDPQNGDILAMASFPSFEPTRVSEYLTGKQSPLFHRAVAAYNCGSVFKIASVATALENGVPLAQSYNCNGRLTVGANIIQCHYHLGHGKQTLSEGFINSCNPYFIHLIRDVGGNALYRMATSMSFNSALVLCPGMVTAPAVFPAIEQLLQPTALANVSFGQGDLAATPVHIAQMTAAVVNNGNLYPARLVRGTVNAYGVCTETELEPPLRIFSPSTATALQDMMRAVITEGNGKTANPDKGGAGGKTGTAQTGWKLEDGTTMIQSWFTGFYPAQNPRYVVTVLSEDAGTTNQPAAPIFKLVCDELANLS